MANSIFNNGRYAIGGNGRNSLHHIHVDDVLEGIFGATAFSAAAGEEPIAFDTSKAKRLIGFLPRVSYEEGIERIVAER